MKRAESRGLSSLLIWTTAASPARSSATFRTAGANETQWGHQGAQNSASTGPLYPEMKASKLSSFNCWG